MRKEREEVEDVVTVSNNLKKERDEVEDVVNADLKRQRMSSLASEGHIEPTTEGSWEIQLEGPSGLVDVVLSVDRESYEQLCLPTPAPSQPLRLDSLADTGSDACAISTELFANFGNWVSRTESKGNFELRALFYPFS